MALSQNNSLTALAAVYARKVVQMAVQMDPNYWFEQNMRRSQMFQKVEYGLPAKI